MNRKYHINAFRGLLVFLLVLSLNSCGAKSTESLSILSPAVASPSPLDLSYTNETPRAETAHQSELFHVSINFPSYWQQTDQYMEGYQGVDGYFGFYAKQTENPATIQFVCEDEIHQTLAPFGSKPTVQYLVIDGQEACLILPSRDQLQEMKGEAEVVVRYPQPVMIDDASYSFFQLFSDKTHIQDITATIQFLP